MRLSVTTLSAAVDHQDGETVIGTLEVAGGVPPYEIVAIWPAGPVSDFDPDRIALGAWRGRLPRPAAARRGRTPRAAAAWRGRLVRPEATWT